MSDKRIGQLEARLQTYSECMGGLAKRIAELEGVTGSALTGRLGRFEASAASLSARLAKLEGDKAEVQDDGELAKTMADAWPKLVKALEPYTQHGENLALGLVDCVRGVVADRQDRGREIDRLNATNADLRTELGKARAELAKATRELTRWVDEACDVARALAPYREETSAAFVSRAPDVAALVAEWRERGTDVDRLNRELDMRRELDTERGARAAAERSLIWRLTADLDAARDGLRTAQSCLDRKGVPLVGDALGAVERGLAKSAPSLSDITTPKPAAEVVNEAVAEAAPDLTAANAYTAIIDKSSALEANGWTWDKLYGWTDGDRRIWSTDDAHAAMLGDEAKRAAPESDKAAELLAAGWQHENAACGWIPRGNPAPVYTTVKDAHAAMLADRARTTPRDTLTDPRPGDLYVDRFGDFWLYTTAAVITSYGQHFEDARGRLRPANPEEVTKFRAELGLA